MTASEHEAARQHNRALWSEVNEQFTAHDGADRWNDDSITWGLFRVPEDTVHTLGDLHDRDVVELGCGTAYFSAWMSRCGARPVAVDLSRPQLVTAQRCQHQHGPAFPLVEADANLVPLRSASFDLVVSEYGAGPWCEPARWLPEAARLLRPGGRLVFLTNSVLAALCVPSEGGFAEERLQRSVHDLLPVTWPGGGIEYHPGHGVWIRHLRDAGFVIDALHELHPPDGAGTHDFYDIVTAEWARKWPAEDLWVAHLG